ncbi:radial spoke head 10 homolog B-like isoform X5 [Apis florea]|uniref:radial spoke head 10 homolog B-like isoform X5 n=1 Tax=Apis florea TaxID=7463 RepID=UPI0012FF3411|nr:radial spoke head 10 homolog B-like isoform X5 [Apis florea]
MHGKGLLEWNNVCWYEGDFINGYRHGRGMMVDGENRYMYTGQWYKGLRHGKGYARYEDNGSYDGDWVMDKMNGIGLRIYPSGARYVGQWKNGIRDGIGTMVWTNGNFYRGEWKCGSMHGTFTWPQEASYSGDMKFNSVGGAKYSGYWKDNKKHGYGIIFGNNGEKFEADPLFLNDILCTDIMKDNKDNNNLENKSEVKDKEECIITDLKPKFIEKPAELAKGFVTPILKPEQFPYLTYYITRLLDPESLEPRFEPSISSGRCYSCENESCACLHYVPSKDIVINEIVNEIDQNDFPQEQLFKSDVIDVKKSEWNYEECWIYKCLMIHILRLRQIYNDYAKLFANPAPKCNLVMSRLCLWQLWRDCNIQKKISLSEIDKHIAKNKSTMVKDPHYPFEKIEIWQFLHALLEVSWHLYTKYNNIEVGEMNGKLANGLHKFLKNDIFPYVGNHVGTLCNENKDILPMNCVFEFYRQIGYPPSARDLLQSTCILIYAKDSRLFATTIENMKIFPEGINSVTIGEKISYLLKLNEIFTLHNYTTDISKKNENNLINKLLIFSQLGAVKMIEVMTLICPGIKDTNTGIIINMDYKLTFLEFYEIILEATKELLFLKNKSEKLLQTKIEKEIKSVEINNL